jgi:hypothetical protein
MPGPAFADRLRAGDDGQTGKPDAFAATLREVLSA